MDISDLKTGDRTQTCKSFRFTECWKCDQEMAAKVVDAMKETGVRFLFNSGLKKIEKLSDGKLNVFWHTSGEKGVIENSDIYDTVFMAVGEYKLSDRNLLFIGSKKSAIFCFC